MTAKLKKTPRRPRPSAKATAKLKASAAPPKPTEHEALAARVTELEKAEKILRTDVDNVRKHVRAMQAARYAERHAALYAPIPRVRRFVTGIATAVRMAGRSIVREAKAVVAPTPPVPDEMSGLMSSVLSSAAVSIGAAYLASKMFGKNAGTK